LIESLNASSHPLSALGRDLSPKSPRK
jgi:hypothetical protein